MNTAVSDISGQGFEFLLNGGPSAARKARQAVTAGTSVWFEIEAEL